MTVVSSALVDSSLSVAVDVARVVGATGVDVAVDIAVDIAVSVEVAVAMDAAVDVVAVGGVDEAPVGGVGVTVDVAVEDVAVANIASSGEIVRSVRDGTVGLAVVAVDGLAVDRLAVDGGLAVGLCHGGFWNTGSRGVPRCRPVGRGRMTVLAGVIAVASSGMNISSRSGSKPRTSLTKVFCDSAMVACPI